MGGGPASADVVRSSCFVTFPEQAHAEPVPVDAWYLFAAGLTFLRRLSRDRVGDNMHIALLLQVPDEERRYVSVSSNTVLQEALQETFECPEKALVLHVIDVGRVRGQKRIHVRPAVNPNVSPEPVEALELVFPILSIDRVEAPTAVELPAAQVTRESLYDQMSRSMFNYRKDDSIQWNGARSMKKEEQSLSHSAFFVEERDYTRRETREEKKEQKKEKEERRQQAGVSVAIEAVGDLLPPAKQMESSLVEQGDERAIPMATLVETDAAHIPCDYVMLELQTGAGLPEFSATTSSTYFISSRWAEQADEMSASMSLERPSSSSATSVHAVSSVGNNIDSHVNIEDSFVLLERQEL
ncbi:unnamed protein product [Peronospora effusa]|uniref:Uncharacterized protein n=1 Tax=Peronospora effusa TaxID=542832 RepID=A0A3M6V7Q3_9STRA|nr:hypothetical protein DD238_007339 [Peronospora effusa]RQM08954.1 hypothetical protein DD237_006274 [Peronospora effusa]CAI5714377.1 unnamed protein product [Peronospora effusa]